MDVFGDLEAEVRRELDALGPLSPARLTPEPSGLTPEPSWGARLPHQGATTLEELLQDSDTESDASVSFSRPQSSRPHHKPLMAVFERVRNQDALVQRVQKSIDEFSHQLSTVPVRAESLARDRPGDASTSGRPASSVGRTASNIDLIRASFAWSALSGASGGAASRPPSALSSLPSTPDLSSNRTTNAGLREGEVLPQHGAGVAPEGVVPGEAEAGPTAGAEAWQRADSGAAPSVANAPSTADAPEDAESSDGVEAEAARERRRRALQEEEERLAWEARQEAEAYEAAMRDRRLRRQEEERAAREAEAEQRRALEEAEEQRRRQALREMEARLAEGQRRAEEERAAAEAELRRVQEEQAAQAEGLRRRRAAGVIARHWRAWLGSAVRGARVEAAVRIQAAMRGALSRRHAEAERRRRADCDQALRALQRALEDGDAPAAQQAMGAAAAAGARDEALRLRAAFEGQVAQAKERLSAAAETGTFEEFTAAAVACRALGSAAAACVPPAEARVQDRRAAAERAAREAADRGARGEARDWCAKAKALGSSVQALHRIETAAVEASRALVAELQAAARGPGFDEARWRRARASAVAAGLGRYVREEEQALAARRARVSASLRDLRAALAPASSRGLLGFAAADGAAPPLAGSVALAEEALADAARLGLAQEAALTREVLARERSRCAEGLAAAAAAGDVSAYEAAAEAAREAGVDAGALAMAQRQFGHRRAEAETAVLEAGSTGTLAAFASALRAAGPMLPGGPGSALLRAREAMAARRLRCAAALRDAAVAALQGFLPASSSRAPRECWGDEGASNSGGVKGAALQGFLPASSSRAPRECWGDEGASNSGGVKGVGSRTQDDLARAMARLRPALAEANALGLAGGIAAAVEALRAAARAREAAGAGVVAQCVLERLEGSMCRGDKCEESEDAVASRVDEMVAYEAQHASTRGADGVPWVSARRPMWPPAADAAAVVVGHAAFAAAQAEPGAGPPGHRAAGVINTPAPLTPALHAPSDAVATRPTSRASDASFHKDVPDNILTGQMLQERLVGLSPSTLAALDLSSTALTGLGKALSHATLPSLTRLRLDSCHLRSLDGIEGLARLTELSVRHNQLSDAGALRHLSSLRTLSLDENFLTDAAPIASCTALTQLSVSGNDLAHVQLHALRGLESLNIANNPLASDAGLACCSSLTMLNVAGCQLPSLASVAHMPVLRTLVASHNRITTLPPFASALLQEAWLDGNCIVYVQSVPWLPHLRALYLQDNEVVSLCPLSTLPVLHTLDVSFNALMDRGALHCVAAATTLRVLRIQENPLCALPHHARHVHKVLPWLSELDNEPISAPARARHLTAALRGSPRLGCAVALGSPNMAGPGGPSPVWSIAGVLRKLSGGDGGAGAEAAMPGAGPASARGTGRGARSDGAVLADANGQSGDAAAEALAIAMGHLVRGSVTGAGVVGRRHARGEGWAGRLRSAADAWRAATLAHMAAAQHEQQRAAIAGQRRAQGARRAVQASHSARSLPVGSNAAESAQGDAGALLPLLRRHAAQCSRSDLSTHQCVFVPSKSYLSMVAAKRDAAATRLQVAWRGVAARRLASRLREWKRSTGLHAAAAAIQAVWRGWRWRASGAINALREERAARLAAAEARRTAAVTKLQAAFRGHVVRRRLRKALQACGAAPVACAWLFRAAPARPGHSARRGYGRGRAGRDDDDDDLEEIGDDFLAPPPDLAAELGLDFDLTRPAPVSAIAALRASTGTVRAPERPVERTQVARSQAWATPGETSAGPSGAERHMPPLLASAAPAVAAKPSSIPVAATSAPAADVRASSGIAASSDIARRAAAQAAEAEARARARVLQQMLERGAAPESVARLSQLWPGARGTSGAAGSGPGKGNAPGAPAPYPRVPYPGLKSQDRPGTSGSGSGAGDGGGAGGFGPSLAGEASAGAGPGGAASPAADRKREAHEDRVKRMVEEWGFKDAKTAEAYFKMVKKRRRIREGDKHMAKYKDPEARLDRLRRAIQAAPPVEELTRRERQHGPELPLHQGRMDLEAPAVPSPGVAPRPGPREDGRAWQPAGQGQGGTPLRGEGSSAHASEHASARRPLPNEVAYRGPSVGRRLGDRLEAAAMEAREVGIDDLPGVAGMPWGVRAARR